MVRGSSAPCPTIIVSTHGSWWDAVVTIVMSLRRYRLDADGMMEYRQLTKYRFFSRIGMFSVVREDPRSAVRSLHYAADRLRNTGSRTLDVPARNPHPPRPSGGRRTRHRYPRPQTWPRPYPAPFPFAMNC
ncbi:MAG: hypothetical protein IPM83_15075 [Ignavibacteria bacterium]|nr:hypothetical protein [Ignavibacteria bacterium]